MKAVSQSLLVSSFLELFRHAGSRLAVRKRRNNRRVQHHIDLTDPQS